MKRRRPESHLELPDRAAGYGLLISAVLSLLPQLLRWPWWLLPLLAMLFAWRFFMLRRGWPVPGALIRIGLTGLVLVLVYRHFGTVFGRDAGSALLAGLLALKSLELRRLRDYMVCVFLIYFLILVSFLYSQEPWLVLYLVAVLAATTATLVRLALPGISGRRATRLALRLLVQAVPLMLVMYLLFPRIQGALWGMPQDAYSGLSGLSEEMRPGDVRELTLSDEVAFRAYFPDRLPRPSDLYWRAIVLGQFDGRTWTRGREFPTQQPKVSNRSQLPYTLTLEPSNRPWLPALEWAVYRPAGTRLRTGSALEWRQPVRERLVVEMQAQPGDALAAATPAELAASLIQPPASTRVQTLAAQLRRGRGDRETLRAALAYFHDQEFRYTLIPPVLGEDPVDEFLFESRRGFCEHFASAFVVLLRTAGIPARVVTGYQGGEFNPGGRYFIVRQLDAHAWAEAWIPGEGWVRADPTAAVAPERIEFGADALRRLVSRGATLGRLAPGALELDWLERMRRDTRLAVDLVQSTWSRWVLGYNPERQREFLTALGLGDFTAARLVGLLALVVALMFAGYLLITRPRRPRLDPVQRAYLRFCRKLARAGLTRAPHEGPQDFAKRCVRERPDLSEDVRTITELYVQLRYGSPDTVVPSEDFAHRVTRFHTT